MSDPLTARAPRNGLCEDAARRLRANVALRRSLRRRLARKRLHLEMASRLLAGMNTDRAAWKGDRLAHAAWRQAGDLLRLAEEEYGGPP